MWKAFGSYYVVVRQTVANETYYFGRIHTKDLTKLQAKQLANSLNS